MDERVLELLSTVVSQNAELIRQNKEVIDFIKVRDASLAERYRLDVEHSTMELNRAKENIGHIKHVCETLAIGEGDLVMVRILAELGSYDAGKILREKIKASGRLPEKTSD